MLGNKEFWKIIKHIDWEGCGCDIAEAKRRMLEKVSPCNSLDFITDNKRMTLKDFQDTFEKIVSLINDETNKRTDNNKRSFAKNVSHGADDCHYIDLPAHLIGRGKKSVEDYLNGRLVKHEVVECLSYIFHQE